MVCSQKANQVRDWVEKKVEEADTAAEMEKEEQKDLFRDKLAEDTMSGQFAGEEYEQTQFTGVDEVVWNRIEEDIDDEGKLLLADLIEGACEDASYNVVMNLIASIGAAFALGAAAGITVISIWQKHR